MKKSLLVAALYALSGCEPHEASQNDSAEHQHIPEAPKGWSYDVSKDDMRGTTRWAANLRATDMPLLDFPYEGGSPASISIGQSSDEGPFDEGAYLVFSHGQLECGQVCYLSAKFDNGKVFEIASPRQDCGQDQCVNLSIRNDIDDLVNGKPPRSFAREMINAKMLVLEVPIYKFGNYQFKFNIENLKWPQPGAPLEKKGANK